MGFLVNHMWNFYNKFVATIDKLLVKTLSYLMEVTSELSFCGLQTNEIPSILCIDTTFLLSNIIAHLISHNGMNEILKSWKPKEMMGLKVHHGGFKPTNSLEWHSAVPFREVEHGHFTRAQTNNNNNSRIGNLNKGSYED